MKKVLIINGHQYYDNVAKGELTQHFIDKANDFFVKNNFEVNNHQPTKKQVQVIVEQIAQRDLPFLKQQIQSLEQALAIAQRNRR